MHGFSFAADMSSAVIYKFATLIPIFLFIFGKVLLINLNNFGTNGQFVWANMNNRGVACF